MRVNPVDIKGILSDASTNDGLIHDLSIATGNVVEEDDGTEKEDGLIRKTMELRALQNDVTDIGNSLKAIHSAGYNGNEAAVLMYVAGAAYQVDLLNTYGE